MVPGGGSDVNGAGRVREGKEQCKCERRCLRAVVKVKEDVAQGREGAQGCTNCQPEHRGTGKGCTDEGDLSQQFRPSLIASPLTSSLQASHKRSQGDTGRKSEIFPAPSCCCSFCSPIVILLICLGRMTQLKQ